MQDLSFKLASTWSGFVGVLVMHAAFVLSHTTSALTMSVMGIGKSISISMVDALTSRDYQYSPLNLAWQLISMRGAVLYTARPF